MPRISTQAKYSIETMARLSRNSCTAYVLRNYSQKDVLSVQVTEVSHHTSKVLGYGTCSQGISQFHLHTPHSSANRMNHTCLCLPRSPNSLYYIPPFYVNLPCHGKALNSLICADVLLRNCSLTHSLCLSSRSWYSFTDRGGRGGFKEYSDRRGACHMVSGGP